MPLRPFTLNLFGHFEARCDGRPLVGFATDKVRALLAYLAGGPDRPHRRETLAAHKSIL
jgi:DNA-binding SARP family transcriptional activator